MAKGIAEHSFTGPAVNSIFNLGNPQPMTMKDLALLIHRVAQELGLIAKTSKPLRFESRKSYADDVRIRIPAVHKAKKILGWRPELSVEESVRRCLEELR